MSNITAATQTLPAVANNPCGIENNLWIALRYVIYPDAEDKTIKTIHDTCLAQGLDVRQKPYHAVKIQGKDVIWPSISLARIQAVRTNQHLGTSEPEYGPLITAKYGDKMITHPEWCKIYIKKAVGNFVAEFVGMAIWKESYKPGNGYAPNAMWSNRICSQLAKCAEADGLRRAFPDHVSQEPTAEEMEGLNDMKNITPRPKSLSLSERLSEKLEEIDGAQDATTSEMETVTKNATVELEPLVPMTPNNKPQVETAVDKLIKKEINNEIPEKLHKDMCDHFKVTELQFLSETDAQKCLNRLAKEHNKQEYEDVQHEAP